MGDLDAAIGALDERDDPAALTHILEAWAQSRDLALGRSIDQLQKRICRTPPAWANDWLARESEGLSVDTPVLAGWLATGDPTRAELVERLRRLLLRTPHPHAFRSLMRLVQGVPHPRFESAIEDLLRHHADPEAGVEWIDSRPGARRWNQLLARIEAYLPTVPVEKMPGSWDLLRSVRSGARPKMVTDPLLDDLWRRVGESPENDGPRLIFADRVHGSDQNLSLFIQLQIASERQPLAPRDAAWLATAERNSAQFLGPLQRKLMPTGLRLRRGFLDAGNALAWRKAPPAHHWRTATAIWAEDPKEYGLPGLSDLWSAGTFALKDREGHWRRHSGGKALAERQIRKVVRGGPWPWRVLQVKAVGDDGRALIDILASLRAPRLETVVLAGPQVPRAVFDVLPKGVEIVLQPPQMPLAELLWLCPELPSLTLLGAFRLEMVRPLEWYLHPLGSPDPLSWDEQRSSFARVLADTSRGLLLPN